MDGFGPLSHKCFSGRLFSKNQIQLVTGGGTLSWLCLRLHVHLLVSLTCRGQSREFRAMEVGRVQLDLAFAHRNNNERHERTTYNNAQHNGDWDNPC